MEFIQFTHIPQIYIAQCIGVVACAIGCFAFLQRKERCLKFWFCMCTLLISCHYILQGIYVGAAMEMFNSIRTAISFLPWAMYCTPYFCGAYLLTGLFLYQTPVDILPVIAATIGTIAFFNLKGIYLRTAMLGSFGIWIAYGVIHQSIGVVVMESFFFMANLYAISVILKKRHHKELQSQHA